MLIIIVIRVEGISVATLPPCTSPRSLVEQERIQWLLRPSAHASTSERVQLISHIVKALDVTQRRQALNGG